MLLIGMPIYDLFSALFAKHNVMYPERICMQEARFYAVVIFVHCMYARWETIRVSLNVYMSPS